MTLLIERRTCKGKAYALLEASHYHSPIIHSVLFTCLALYHLTKGHYRAYRDIFLTRSTMIAAVDRPLISKEALIPGLRTGVSLEGRLTMSAQCCKPV